MTKYRIIERKYSDGEVTYVCQKKVLWRWKEIIFHVGGWDFAECSSLEAAKSLMPKKVRRTIMGEKIVFIGSD